VPALNIEFINDDARFFSKVEDDLEREILGALGKKDLSGISNDVFMHLSPLRHNLLNWYTFNNDCNILEIGAGLGALTGYLCGVAKNVIAVEKKNSRAQIIKKRFSSFQNLTVESTNIFDLAIINKFDYIIITDIFAYARKYIKTDNAHVTLLKKAKDLLNQDGKILLAVENKLGLKYFSGAPETHSHKFFVGLNNFDGYDIIRTFSKSELLEICNLAGFNHINFYYPYPDHLFPLEIYTDESAVTFGSRYTDNDIDVERFSFFDEQNIYALLEKEKVATTFANSFLLEISLQPEKAKTQYHHFKLDQELSRRYLPKYRQNFFYPVDVVLFGDKISSNLQGHNGRSDIYISEEILLAKFKQYIKLKESDVGDISTLNSLKYDIDSYINSRIKKCEDLYNIETLFWFGVGSLVTGIFRKNSDLDIRFIYKCKGEKVAAIHDIVGYGFDFWAWDITDVLLFLQNGGKDVLSSEHARGSLDYCAGIFSMLGNEISGQYNSSYDKATDHLVKLFSKKICIEYFINLAQNIYLKREQSHILSYYEYLNCIEYLLACEHILENGLPGDIHICKLSKKYLDESMLYLLNELIAAYRDSASKHAQKKDIPLFNDFISNKLSELTAKSRAIEDDTSNVLENINELKQIFC